MNTAARRVAVLAFLRACRFTEPLNNVASGRLVVGAGAQEAQCTWWYMSIPSTADRRQTLAQ